jgi:hypothetical protein
MITELARSPDRPLAQLANLTRRRLLTLALTEQPLAPSFAHAQSGKKTELFAQRWRIGDGQAPLAELRFVRILGSASEIVNTMIFPARPDLTPVFAAEILLFGGQPRLALIDVQTPGLRPDIADRLRRRLAQLRATWPPSPDAAIAPEWATEHSTGLYLFERPQARAATQRLIQAYDQYLRTWREFAEAALLEEDPTKPAPDAAQFALRDYKDHHLAHTPGKDFLNKVFGFEWTESFLNHFLYR